MSKIILITGGARSGKSSHAERLFQETDDVLYIATAIRTDGEMTERINHHIRSRNPKWQTHEGYRDLDQVIAVTDHPYILLDCVTNMISNLMFQLSADPEQLSLKEGEALFEKIKEEFARLLSAVREADKALILVSNEVGMGLISEYKLGRMFVDYAGFINQLIAREADEVYFMVSGLPLTVKQDSRLVHYGGLEALADQLDLVADEADEPSDKGSFEEEASQGPGMTEDL